MLINPNQTNAVAFSVYLGTLTSITNAVTTKVPHDTIVFDTGNFFTTSNSRFKPTISGKYLLSATVTINSNDAGVNTISYIVLNGIQTGTNIKWSFTNNGSGVAGQIVATCTAIFFLNGVSDYVEAYVNQGSAAARNADNNPYSTYFCGCLIGP